MKNFLTHSNKIKYRFVPAILVLLFGFAATGIIFYQTLLAEQKRVKNIFDESTERISTAMEAEINQDVALLKPLRAFYLSSQSVERAEFALFAGELLKGHEVLTSLEWLPRVSGSEKKAFEENARKEGLSDFSIRDNFKNNQPQERPFYFPVYYNVSQLVHAEAILGRDYASVIERREAMERAATAGDLATSSVSLFKRFDKKNPYGFVVFLPVFNKGGDESLSEGLENENLKGFVAAVFNAKQTAESAFNRVRRQGIKMRVFAAMSDGGLISVYPDSGLRYGMMPDEGRRVRFKNLQAFETAGLRWLLLSESEQAFLDRYARYTPWVVLVVGLLTAVLLSGYLFFLDSRRMQQTFKELSLIDELTGIYNRRGFQNLEEYCVRLSKRSGKGFYVLLMDLDRFKSINDKLGHLEGDKALKIFASVLKSVFRESDVLARFGGDEFVVIAFDLNPSGLGAILSRLYKALKARNLRREIMADVWASVGAAYFDPHHDPAPQLEDLLAEADKDLYLNKNSVCRFMPIDRTAHSR